MVKIWSTRHLQTSKTTDANDEKCRSDANLMKEVERGHFVVSFITGRSNFKLNDRAVTYSIDVEQNTF